MMQEALDDIVIADGKGKKRAEPDEETGQGEDHEVEMVLETGAVYTETDGEENAGKKGVGESVLSVPGSAPAAGKPEGYLVVEEVPIDLGADDSDPGGHCEECHLQ